MVSQRKPVCGIAINDVYDDCFTEPQPKYYKSWKRMFERCYSQKYHQRQPTYINCSVSKEWIYLSNFREWFNENYVDGYQLDKDLLYPGNKVYGPDTCVFVPQNINNLFIFRNSNRGEYSLGVSFHKRDKIFRANCLDGKRKYIIKFFKDPVEAHFWYLEQKINVIDKYLQEDHSNKIKIGLSRWKQLLTYHIDNKIIFVPEQIDYDEQRFQNRCHGV